MRLEFKLAYYNLTAKQIIHNTPGTSWDYTEK